MSSEHPTSRAPERVYEVAASFFVTATSREEAVEMFRPHGENVPDDVGTYLGAWAIEDDRAL